MLYSFIPVQMQMEGYCQKCLPPEHLIKHLINKQHKLTDWVKLHCWFFFKCCTFLCEDGVKVKHGVELVIFLLNRIADCAIY